jgi:hypothetical protein
LHASAAALAKRGIQFAGFLSAPASNLANPNPQYGFKTVTDQRIGLISKTTGERGAIDALSLLGKTSSWGISSCYEDARSKAIDVHFSLG